MTDRDEVERLTEAAFADSPLEDPRARYREHLRALRSRDAAAFEAAVARYESELMPAVAAEGGDVVGAWREYGRALAELSGAGRTVAVDEQGRAASWEGEGEATLVLHVPDDATVPPLVVAAPRNPSPAQKATIALLVEGAVELRED